MCSNDAQEMVQELGADEIVDYKSEDFQNVLKSLPK